LFSCWPGVQLVYLLTIMQLVFLLDRREACLPVGRRGLYFALKTIFIPPFPKMIFLPLSLHIILLLLSCPFCLICALFALILPYFAFNLPIFSFSSLVHPFSSPFLHFLLYFLFSLSLLIFFPQMTLADLQYIDKTS
jgi:hypothetical protein